MLVKLCLYNIFKKNESSNLFLCFLKNRRERETILVYVYGYIVFIYTADYKKGKGSNYYEEGIKPFTYSVNDFMRVICKCYGV